MIKSYNIRAYDINTGKYLFLTYSYTPPMFGISRFGGNKYDVHKINYKFEKKMSITSMQIYLLKKLEIEV